MKKDLHSSRKRVITIVFIVIWAAFVVRLFSIQVLNDKYKKSSATISIRQEIIIPSRGTILDRNGVVLVQNQKSYDLMAIPVEIKPFDTLMLCNILGIEPSVLSEMLRQAGSDPYRKVNPLLIEKQMLPERVSMLQEVLFRFPGFTIQERAIRNYPGGMAAHTLGYIGEVDLKKTLEDSYYISGDYIGISGIEKSYEEVLRGSKGVKKLLKDKFNRNQGPYLGGREDVEAISGKDLYLTLDARLQEYGEMLMQNKIGSIVAIEPSTGEILALVTSPTYDPNLLSGRTRAQNYQNLLEDRNKPLMNRALQAQYPPGSTFKIVNALIGQEMGILNPGTKYGCSAGFHMGSLTVGCHNHPSPLNLTQSIQHSCNAYYCWAQRDMLEKSGYPTIKAAYDVWRKHALSLGLGLRFDNDLPYGYKGNIPSSDYYDKLHGKGRWKALTVISISIGQGEVLTTPVQLANLAALVSNRGYYITPHMVRAIGSADSLNKPMMKRHQTSIHPQYFEPVIQGMRDVVLAGTARNAAIEGFAVCGKTGTAQNPHGPNHSLFIAFAPMENPKIAIAVIVENSGYGATWAAPIASLMMEKYLNGEVKRPDVETRMKNCNLMRP
ncbi:MAG TPA: penicillin-binding protein 2 [Bacteroidales bacterium]|nr:penicillin-binding protein 2 [Bacteroidales bacterium]HRZ49510.1 penicillin-binding protein 2 [Bacteroidales bacterium]